MKKASIILVVICFLLFLGNYHISDYLYPTNSPEDIKGFWHTKNDIYSIIIALLFLYGSIGKKRWLGFMFDIFTGLTFSNVVDRLFFNVREWRGNDIIMIVLTLLFAFANFKYNERRDKQRASS